MFGDVATCLCTTILPICHSKTDCNICTVNIAMKVLNAYMMSVILFFRFILSSTGQCIDSICAFHECYVKVLLDTCLVYYIHSQKGSLFARWRGFYMILPCYLPQISFYNIF